MYNRYAQMGGVISTKYNSADFGSYDRMLINNSNLGGVMKTRNRQADFGGVMKTRYKQADFGSMAGLDFSNLFNSTIQSVESSIKKAIPGIQQTALNKILESPEGQQILNATQETAIKLGEQQAAAKAAEQTMAYQQQLQDYYASAITDIKANYKKYGMYAGIGVGGLVLIWILSKAMKRKKS